MIHAVILAGGWGSRLWPQSRKKTPKQLFCLGRRCPPVQNLFKMIKTVIPKQRIWVVTTQDYARYLSKLLPSLPKKNFLVEPVCKNTAAAIGAVSAIISRTDPQAVSIVLSSDAWVAPQQAFLQTIRTAVSKVLETDALVVLGIRPQRIATEFGYLKVTHRLGSRVSINKMYKVNKFIEKPAYARAKRYISSKSYLWNSGIFVWRVNTILKAIEKNLPRLYSGLERITASYKLPGYKKRLFTEYRKFKNISIDYGVMEKASNIYTVVGAFSWQDLGSWNNFSYSNLIPDRDGNIIQGLHKGIATQNSIIFSEGKHLVGTVGVRDLIIVHTPSATLVCKKDKAQKVKNFTEALDRDKRLKQFL